MSQLPTFVVRAAAALTLAACTDPGGITVVTVRTRPAVGALDRLAVAVVNGDSTRTQRFDVADRSFPLTFSIQSGDRTGELGITIEGIDHDGAAIAAGAVTIALDPDERLAAEVVLDPHDFQVNTSYAGDQALSFRDDSSSGRQLDVGPTGIATIGWSDWCDIPGRCDVFGRRFDTLGNPVPTAIAAGVSEFHINRSTDVLGFEPSLATNRDGVTLAVWSDGHNLFAVAIDAGGSALSEVETFLTPDVDPSTPAVAALASGNFVVTWTEDGPLAGTYAVRSCYVDGTGQLAPNPLNSSTSSYGVSTTQLTRNTPPATVSLADGNAHAVVWRAGSTIRGRFYDDAGLPRAGEVTLATYPTSDQLGQPLIARLEQDIVMTYARKTMPPGDADAGELILCRLTTAGQRVGVDSLATREVDLLPAALTVRPDGAIAVAWAACQEESDGSECGIRMLMFRPTLAQVGVSQLVNTTRTNDQLDPSIATLDDVSFIAAWSDNSGAAPDGNGFGVRARILYPTYDDAHSVLGARCAASAECGAGNVCMPGSDNMPRRFRACTADACPAGGTCTTLASESGCLF